MINVIMPSGLCTSADWLQGKEEDWKFLLGISLILYNSSFDVALEDDNKMTKITFG